MNSQLERRKKSNLDLIEIERSNNSTNVYKEMSETLANFAETLKVMYNSVVMLRLQTADVRLQYQSAFDQLELTKKMLESRMKQNNENFKSAAGVDRTE